MVGVFHHVCPYDRSWKAAETSLRNGGARPRPIWGRRRRCTLISSGSPVKNWDLKENFDGYNHSKWGFHHAINDTQ